MNETTRPTDGPWKWTTFCKSSGEPILTVEDVAETVAGSAAHSERAELWGVTLDDAKDNPDGRATVVCYTGNGPNAHNNARVIAGVPIMTVCARSAGYVSVWALSRVETLRQGIIGAPHPDRDTRRTGGWG